MLPNKFMEISRRQFALICLVAGVLAGTITSAHLWIDGGAIVVAMAAAIILWRGRETIEGQRTGMLTKNTMQDPGKWWIVPIGILGASLLSLLVALAALPWWLLAIPVVAIVVLLMLRVIAGVSSHGLYFGSLVVGACLGFEQALTLQLMCALAGALWGTVLLAHALYMGEEESWEVEALALFLALAALAVCVIALLLNR